MEQKYCEYLNNCISFHRQGITFCTSLWVQEDSHIPYKGDFLKNFFEKKQNILTMMKNGQNLDFCKNCLYLKNFDSNEQHNNKIKKIEVYHWNECNCACFYCSNRNETKLKITNKKIKGQISILKALKKMKELGQLDNDLAIHTIGGEPTLLKEFKDILKFALKNKYKVNLLTNGILYEDYIPKLLKIRNESIITISLDCGTKETFKKIKRVDKFNDVIKNIEKYIQKSGEHSMQILMKYIILNGVNDTKEEIDRWIDICVSIGVKNFFPSIEFCHSVNNHNNNSINPHIVELYNYIKTRVKEINPNFFISTYDFLEEKIIKYQTYDIR